MLKKRKKSKLSPRKVQEGVAGNFFVYGILVLLIILGFLIIGGLPTQSSSHSGTQVKIVQPKTNTQYNSLQMRTFDYITITPTPKLR